jgi:N-methylhydantoinase A/oxoprolinase/acetone carboxylase beta subunit
VAIGVLPDLPHEPSLPIAPATEMRGERKIYLGGWITVPVYDFDCLSRSQVIKGPAIVESTMTTVLLGAGDCAEVTPHGWLDIALPTRQDQTSR